MKINDRLQPALKADRVDNDMLSVQEVVADVEDAWKASHGKVWMMFALISTTNNVPDLHELPEILLKPAST